MSDSSAILKFQQNILSREYWTAAALGLIEGVDVEVKFGHCPDANPVITDVWEFGGVAGNTPEYIYPDPAGESVTVEGALGDNQPIVIEGLNADPDSNGVIGQPLISGEITLNGTTPVPVPGNWLAVNRCYSEAVVGDKFEGPVLVKGALSGNVFCVASSDDQQSSQAVYMSPAKKIVVINNYSNAINKGGNQDALAIDRLAIGKNGKVFRTKIRYGLQKRGTSNLSSDLIIPVLAGPLSRIKAQAEPDSGPMDVSAEFSMLLFDEELVPDRVLAKVQAN
jgi:hypothetical protein